MNLVDTIVRLSHELGGPDFVLGGGGNSSVKNETTIWVKPSGTALLDLTPERMLALDRAVLATMETLALPGDEQQREQRVNEILMRSVRETGEERRPSVESLLHNALGATYVVHTHPALVNGLTCARDGASACARLFPDALWIPYTNPGYALYARVRAALTEARDRRRGEEPQTLLLENHGVFIGADDPQRVRDLHRAMLEKLAGEYEARGVDTAAVTSGPVPDAEAVARVLHHVREAFDDAGLCMAAAGAFDVPAQPLTPDHLVFMKASPLKAAPTAAAVRAYREQYGYAPRVVTSPDDGVLGLGATPRDAALTLALARDAALVVRLADAFGGVKFMSAEARRFIENWDMEVYRSKVAAGAGG
jgi:rhamnose utilization protein RhaD (predicted bifunctional aldolase and dehydrogenase)